MPEAPHEPEPALIARALSGDRGAWGELVERYTPLVFSIPRRYGLDPDDSADITQTVFAILISRLTSLRDHKSLPKWIVTTTTRECARFVRRRRRLPVVEDNDAGVFEVDSEEHLESEARRRAVRDALPRIGERCQALLMLLFGTEGTPDYQAVSKTLGLPVGSIGPTRARCLKKLADELGSSEFAAAMFGLHKGREPVRPE